MLDIVIVNYKSCEFLQDCLSSLHCSANGHKINVIVFDNHSHDGVEVLKAEFPQIQLMPNDRNIGFAAGVNRVLSQTHNPYILLLNPDTFVFPGFFDAVFSFMNKHEDTGILGTKILDADGCVQGSARAFPSFHTALFGRSSLLSKLFPNNRFTCANVLTGKANGKKPVDVDWVSGACMVVRREALAEVGLLDEGFFMYWEDTDWCSRMWAKGWKVKYWTGAAVVHYVGGSSSKNLLKSVVAFHKSAFRLYCKHNRRRLNVFKPFVFLGLFCRCMLVLSMHGVHRMISRVKKEKLSMADTFKRLAN